MNFKYTHRQNRASLLRNLLSHIIITTQQSFEWFHVHITFMVLMVLSNSFYICKFFEINLYINIFFHEPQFLESLFMQLLDLAKLNDTKREIFGGRGSSCSLISEFIGHFLIIRTSNHIFNFFKIKLYFKIVI